VKNSGYLHFQSRPLRWAEEFTLLPPSHSKCLFNVALAMLTVSPTKALSSWYTPLPPDTGRGARGWGACYARFIGAPLVEAAAHIMRLLPGR
jgi:hypothetical protein